MKKFWLWSLKSMLFAKVVAIMRLEVEECKTFVIFYFICHCPLLARTGSNMGTICSANKKEKKEKKKASAKVEPKNNEKIEQETENLTPNFILVSSNENSEQLPIKKRYRYEVTDLKDILNGNTYLVKSPSKKKLSPETNRKKSKSCLKLNDLDDGEKNGTVTRSRSMSPRKTTNSVTFKNTPRKKSKEKPLSVYVIVLATISGWFEHYLF